jgi:hypothetical protein
VKFCGNEGTTCLQLRTCLRCTVGGCEDGCDIKYCDDTYIYDFLGEVR